MERALYDQRCVSVKPPMYLDFLRISRFRGLLEPRYATRSSDDQISLIIPVLSPSSTRYAWCAARFFFLIVPSRLTIASVGFDRGVGRLPRYLHCHSQCQCHGDLPERDLSSSIRCRRRCRYRCFLPVRLASAGASAGTHLRPL